MTKKRHIKIPYGVASALIHHTVGIKVVSMFLILKHYDDKGAGAVKVDGQLYTSCAMMLNRTERTVHNLIDRLAATGLIRVDNKKIYLASYDELSEYVNSPIYLGKSKKFHHFNRKKNEKNVPFEYILRLYEEKENQDKQRFAKRSKMKQFHQRLTLSSKEEMHIEKTDFQGLAAAFEFGEEYFESCDPDTARGIKTRAKQMNQSSHTGACYWQKRLEDLGLVKITRERLIECLLPKNKIRYSRMGHVFYSNDKKTTVLQLPNLVEPLI